MKKLLFAVLILAFCFAIAGCGEKEDIVYDPAADDPELPDEVWAEQIWNDAAEKMIEQGYAEKSMNEDLLFKYEDNGEIEFSKTGRGTLVNPDREIDGKVIWGRLYLDRSTTPTIYIDTHQPSADEKEGAFPLYTSDRMAAPTKADAFANTRGTCKYLILCTGLCFNIEPEYYFGPVDRRDVSTYVFVIDAANREVIHAEYINSDVPGNSTKSPTGEIFTDTAYQYMNELCQK